MLYPVYVHLGDETHAHGLRDPVFLAEAARSAIR